MVVNLLIVVLLLIVGGLIYIAGPVLHIQGNSLLLLRVLLATIGIAAVSAILFLHRRKGLAENSDSNGSVSDLDTLLQDAERKLRTSQQAGPKSLNSMPLIYLLGDANAAKTTIMLHSSLDPELIAGHIYSSADIVATPLVNIWYASGFAILEAGQAIRSSAPLLGRLLHRTRPIAYRSAFGKGAPPRAAVVCVSMERFVGADAASSAAAGSRTVGVQLREISRKMGAAIPVYVLFTKLDHVPHFAEFVRNLSTKESSSVLGNTVSAIRASAGVYTEQATAVIGQALDALFFSLAEFRLELLDRENDAQDAGLVYEFPRELRKLKNPLTQFLVEISKPSQLSANPYLRGFYFTGVRAQVVEQVVGTPAATPKAAPDAGATRMFTLADMQTQPSRPQQVVSKRVPQWIFLPRLFPQVILTDKPALTASKESTSARLFRRVLFGTIATAAVTYCPAAPLLHQKRSARDASPKPRAWLPPAPPFPGCPACSSCKAWIRCAARSSSLRTGSTVALLGNMAGGFIKATIWSSKCPPTLLRSLPSPDPRKHAKSLIPTLNALPASPEPASTTPPPTTRSRRISSPRPTPRRATRSSSPRSLLSIGRATPALGRGRTAACPRPDGFLCR